MPGASGTSATRRPGRRTPTSASPPARRTSSRPIRQLRRAPAARQVDHRRRHGDLRRGLLVRLARLGGAASARRRSSCCTSSPAGWAARSCSPPSRRSSSRSTASDRRSAASALLDGILTFFVMLGFWFVLLDRHRHQERLAAAIAARTVDGRAPDWGPVFWNRPWLIAAGAAFGAATRREVVGPLRHRGGRDLPRRRRRADPAQGRRRVLAGGRDAPAGSRELRPLRARSPSSSTSRRGPAGSSPTAATTGTPPTLRQAQGPMGDRLLVVGAAVAAEPVDLPQGHLRLERGPDLAAQLREPRVAVAAHAAADLDVLPGLGDRRERLHGGRQRLRRERSRASRIRCCGGPR